MSGGLPTWCQDLLLDPKDRVVIHANVAFCRDLFAIHVLWEAVHSVVTLLIYAEQGHMFICAPRTTPSGLNANQKLIYKVYLRSARTRPLFYFFEVTRVKR